MKKPITEVSRRQVVEDEGKNSLELVRTSALVRIADALEIGVADYVKMRRDLEFHRQRVKDLNAEIDRLTLSKAALRGVITRMKNQNKNGTR